MSTEEFCGGYKGTHRFEEGSNQCVCGRAYRRAPRPAPVVISKQRVTRDVQLPEKPGRGKHPCGDPTCEDDHG